MIYYDVLDKIFTEGEDRGRGEGNREGERSIKRAGWEGERVAGGRGISKQEYFVIHK